MGQIWTNKTAENGGYCRINFWTCDKYMNLPGLKYIYTEIDNVRKLCPKKAVKRRGRYPSEQSYDMRFDMSVTNSKCFGWSFAEPIIGRKKYGHSPVIIFTKLKLERLSFMHNLRLIFTMQVTNYI